MFERTSTSRSAVTSKSCIAWNFLLSFGSVHVQPSEAAEPDGAVRVGHTGAENRATATATPSLTRVPFYAVIDRVLATSLLQFEVHYCPPTLPVQSGVSDFDPVHPVSPNQQYPSPNNYPGNSLLHCPLHSPHRFPLHRQ